MEGFAAKTFLVVTILMLLPLTVQSSMDSDAAMSFLDAVENHRHKLQITAQNPIPGSGSGGLTKKEGFLPANDYGNATIRGPCDIGLYHEWSPIYLSEDANFPDYLLQYNRMVEEFLKANDHKRAQEICFHTNEFLECRLESGKPECRCAMNGVWDLYKGVELEGETNGTLTCVVGKGGRCAQKDAPCINTTEIRTTCTKTSTIYNNGNNNIWLCLEFDGDGSSGDFLLSPDHWLLLELTMLMYLKLEFYY